MKFHWHATIENPPAPFVYKSTLEQRDVRGKVFALLTDNVPAFESSLAHLFPRMAGIVVTIGDTFHIESKTELLWYLTTPRTWSDTVPLVSSYLQFIVTLRTEQKQTQKLRIDHERAEVDIRRLTDYAELVQEQLRSDLRKYAEWTVTALTELLKFNVAIAGSDTIDNMPDRIVQFLLSDWFNYGKVNMFGYAVNNLPHWKLLAAGGGILENRPSLPPEQIGDDVQIDQGNLCVPLKVGESAYLIVVANQHPQAKFSDYELTFFRLLATLLIVTLNSKELEQSLQTELDERIRAETAAVKALQAKDEFLASMSHELRTPLNAILGHTQVMREGIYGDISAKHQHVLGSVYKSAEHLLSLINDVLDLAKMDAERGKLDIEKVEIVPLCQECLEMVQENARRKQIKVLSTYDQDATYIWADKRRLKQILLNLLSNAVKFTPERGRVGLEILGDSHAKRMQFSVWDTGIGIAPEDEERLFDRFVQVDSSLAREYEGTGLGLALVKRFVEMHGGHIQLTSELGRGSEFTVTLPNQKLNEMPALSPPKTPASHINEYGLSPDNTPISPSKPLILLAEDNKTNIDLMLAVLGSMDLNVMVAENGKIAIQMAKKHRPDLVLMDIQMPIVDGLEATRELRTMPEMAQMPIIALTGLAMPADQERCMEAGCDDFVTKPIRLKQFQEKINSYLQTHAIR